MLLSQEKGKV